MREIKAKPFAFPLKRDSIALIVIDMQRDFAEPGGFGESLGNDVSRITRIVPDVKRLIEGFRAAGLPVIHTMECHRPNLSDLPPAKRNRGNPALKIGDHGPMGRVLISGEAGTAILDAVAPIDGEVVIEKPGKGAFYATPLGDILKERGIEQLVFAGVPPKSAFRRRCARPMTAATNACSARRRPKAISRNSSLRPSP
jgi:nicotinamidase-related amidase